MNKLSHDLLVRPSLKIWAMYLILFVLFLVILIGGFILIPEFALLDDVWRVFLLSGSATLLYFYVAHTTTTYRINSIEIVHTEGIFSRKVTRIPINRITNYDFEASLLDRLIGIGSVLIDTPGGTGFELKIAKVSKPDSDRIMRFLSSMIAQQKIADSSNNSALRQAVTEDARN